MPFLMEFCFILPQAQYVEIIINKEELSILPPSPYRLICKCFSLFEIFERDYETNMHIAFVTRGMGNEGRHENY